MLQLLLAAGADFTARVHDGFTMLHIASAFGGNDAVLMLILDNGVDINAADKYGETALLQAATTGHLGATKFLLTNGARFDPPGSPSSRKAW